MENTIKNSLKDNIPIIILLLIILFLLFKNKKTNVENLANTDEESLDEKITSKINAIYKADVAAIRNLAEISNKLQTEKGIELPGNLIVSGTFNYLPKGTIVAFNGSKAPNGWAFCDGTNGTPDLRGRFIAGYNKSDSDYNSIGKKGGEKTHKLTIHEMPSHNHGTAGAHYHSYSKGYGGGTRGASKYRRGSPYDRDTHPNTSTSGAHVHSTEGGNRPHENRPPYYVLMYIMKL